MMGFFKKLLNPKEDSIQLSELDRWLDDNNAELRRVKEDIKEVEYIKSEIAENLKILEGVDVSQAKVEERVKSIVQGNLPAYVNAINLFLKKVIVPKEIDHARLESFCSSFESEFESLNKRTFRNFQIIRELVGKELENVAKSVKRLELFVREIKSSSDKVKEIAEIKEKADFIKNSLKNKERNLQRRQELQKEKEELVSLSKRIKDDIEKLKSGKKAKDLEDLKAEEKKVYGQIKELENQLVTLFSPLQKVLKKYNNLCFVKKIDSYIETPVDALLNDSELEILKFLADVKKMIEEGKIDLKADKKKKTLESLDKLDKSFVKDLIEEHSSLNKKLSSVKEEINANTVLKEIDNLEKEFNICSLKIKDIERETDKLKDIDIASEISRLEKRLDEVFGRKIRVENVMG